MKRVSIILYMLLLVSTTLAATDSVEQENMVVVHDQGPAGDVILATNVVTKFDDNFDTAFLLSEIDADDIDEHTTIFIYQGDALVIVGKYAPSADVILATRVSDYLRKQEAIVTNMISDEIKSGRDLTEYVGHGCRAEGEYTTGAVSPDFYVDCCEGLDTFNTNDNNILGASLLCYDPDKGEPICRLEGTKNEGWYYDRTQKLIRFDDCYTDTDFSISLTTDDTYYEVEEDIEVTVTASGNSEVTDTTVTASVTDPTGNVRTYALKQGTCVQAAIACTTGTSCNIPTSCNYDMDFEPKTSGTYKIDITAKLGDSTKTASTRIKVTEETGKVGLDERFRLEIGETVSVKDIRITRTECICPTQELEEGVVSTCDCPTLSLTVEKDADCENSVTSDCTVTGKKIGLLEGNSADAFRYTIVFEDMDNLPVLYVTEEVNKDLVEIRISPDSQTISYDEQASYKVTVIDKNPAMDCTSNAMDCYVQPNIYNIRISNLPFHKFYDSQVRVQPGGSTSFQLIVDPYSIINEPTEVISSTAVTGKPTAKSVTTIAKVSNTGAEEKVQVTTKAAYENTVAAVSRTYTFKVTAQLVGDPEVTDSVSAKFTIEPEDPTPPPFPEDKVTMRLYKGWNLISLPGELVKFENPGFKLQGFVYIKEDQEYLSIAKAQKKLGSKFNRYLAENAFWIYSRENTELTVQIDGWVSSSDLSMVNGWNMMPVTEDMVGGYLTDIIGDCQLDKMYMWDANNQNWRSISTTYTFQEYGYGFLAKSKNTCSLSGPELTPPPMPGGK